MRSREAAMSNRVVTGRVDYARRQFGYAARSI